MPYIYLDKREGTDGDPRNYSITYKLENYDKDPKFEKLAIKITHTFSYGFFYSYYFNLYIYRFQADDKYISYCPDSFGNVAIEIEAIFSKIHPDRPLVLGFKIQSTTYFQYFPYDSLKWKTLPYPPENEILENGLLSLLKEEEKKVDKQLIFRVGTGNNTNIKEIPKRSGKIIYVGNSRTLKKVTFSPNLDSKLGGNENGPWEMYSNNLLTTKSNKIDKFLESVNGKKFKCIVVFYTYPSDLPLLIQFFEDFQKRICFIKKDKNGSHWKEDNDQCNDSDLENRLHKIHSQSSNIDKISYHIGNKQSYDSVEISIEVNNPGDGFTKYTHIPTLKDRKSSIFYGGKKLSDIQGKEINEIDNKKYNRIIVYYSIKADLPILAILTSISTTNICYCIYKKHDTEYYWEKLSQQPCQLEGNNLKAKLREAEFNLVDAIIISLERQHTYGDTEANHTIAVKAINSVKGKIIVKHNSFEASCLKSSNYKMYYHNLDALVKSKNYGFRLFIGNKEIHLYSDTNGNYRAYIYYQKNKNNLYVYFQGNEKRPILLFYNKQAYRPQNIDNYDSKWILTKGIMSYRCSSSDRSQLLPKLNEISEELNPVKIDQTMGPSYVIHKYGPGEVKINLISEKIGHYVKFSHTQESGLRLGNIMYNSTPITDTSNKKPISAGSYNDVVVFYHQCDKRHKNPIFITLKSFGTYLFYYKLSKASNKEYSKVTTTIQLNERVLNPTLELLVQNFLNIIYLKLYERFTYQIRIIGPGFNSDKNKMVSPTISHCDKIRNTNYMCYSHNINGVSGLEGTLKIKIGITMEVDLYATNSEERKESLCYIDKKNEILVFFYNEDPRPLLFSYNNSTYVPNSLTDYSSKWVKLSDITSRTFSESDDGSFKRKLDEISNNLNPVNITQTDEYPVHTQWESIKIKVVRTEQTCYYKYHHTPKAGYRLGKVVYNKDTIEQNIPIPESNEKNSVTVYYYKHDKELSNPLLLELELKSTNTTTTKEYYELKQNGGSYKWAKCNDLLDLKEGDDFETKLLDKLFELNIQFNNQNPIKPQDAGCKKQFPIVEVTVSTVSTAVVGGGTGFLIYKYSSTIIVFITKAF